MTTLSMFLASTPYEGATRPVSARTRSAEKVGSKDRCRYHMAWQGLPCALCGLAGSWLADLDHPARLSFGHIVPLTMWGATNIANLVPQHLSTCNAAARDRDLRGLVDYRVSTLPSLRDAQAWRDAGGMLYAEPAELPTERAIRQARAGRGLTF